MSARAHRRRNVTTSPQRTRRSSAVASKPAVGPAGTVAFWRQKLDAPLFVYFIQDGDDGPVKIGQALDPVSRLRELQCGNPRVLHLRAVVLAADDTEASLHLAWGHVGAAIRGEWFGNGFEDEILNKACGMELQQVETKALAYQVASLASMLIRPTAQAEHWG